MKNLLLINDDGELKMASSIDDGSNSLYINDDLISTTDWVGTGDYTFTIGGVTYTIAKAPSLNGNYQLIPDGGTDFHFERALTKREEHLNQVYPVGAYFETSDTSFDPNASWVGTWENVARKVMRTNGSKTVNAATNYTLCSLTLEANTRYIILGNVTSGSGVNMQMIATFQVTSDATVSTQLGPARTTAGSGGGCTAYLYASTGNATATVDLQCYGYNTTSHTENGVMIAIPLDHQSEGNIWHRVA